MIGQLREVISIVRQNGTADGQGGYLEGTLEEVVATLFAKVEQKNPSREFSFNVIREKTRYQVTCRTADVVGVKPTDLIEWNGKTLAINTILQAKKQNFYTFFECTDFETDGQQGN